MSACVARGFGADHSAKNTIGNSRPFDACTVMTWTLVRAPPARDAGGIFC